MLAVVALIVFVLACFGVDLGDFSLIALGLALLAAHHAFGDRVPGVPRR